MNDTYTHLGLKLKDKIKGSRQYEAIVNRIKKFAKKEIHYREVRLNDKSKEVLENLRQVNNN